MLRGACIHHDNGLLGAAAIGRAEERRIEILKSAGFNAIRSSHNMVRRRSGAQLRRAVLQNRGRPVPQPSHAGHRNPRQTDIIWGLVEQLPYVIGDFAWTGWDYLGEAGLGRTDYTDEEGAAGAGDPDYPWLLAVRRHRHPWLPAPSLVLPRNRVRAPQRTVPRSLPSRGSRQAPPRDAKGVD
jgi:hypothetical protein